MDPGDGVDGGSIVGFKGKLFTVTAALALVAGALARSFAGMEALSPGVLTHLNRAEECLAIGDFERAIAHTETISFERKLRVFVDASMAGRQTKRALRALEESIAMWREAVPDAISVEYVTNRYEADLVFAFQPSVVRDGMSVVGNIQWSRSVDTGIDGLLRGNVKAEIVVRTMRPYGGAMSHDQLRQACLHEIGHLLGLEDHNRVGEIMGPMDFRAPVKRLNEREIWALRELREQTTLIRSEALAQTATRS